MVVFVQLMKQDVQTVVVNMLIDLAFMMAGPMTAENAIIIGSSKQTPIINSFNSLKKLIEFKALSSLIVANLFIDI